MRQASAQLLTSDTVHVRLRTAHSEPKDNVKIDANNITASSKLAYVLGAKELNAFNSEAGDRAFTSL